MCGRSVPRRSGVDDDDAAPGATEHEGGAESGRTAADNGDVIRCCIHGLDRAPRSSAAARFVAVSGNGWVASLPCRTRTPIPDVLAEVGPRFRRVRTKRGVTLDGTRAPTGISKSTLSRLETGQRKPSLEPPLAHSPSPSSAPGRAGRRTRRRRSSDPAQAAAAQRADRRPPHPAARGPHAWKVVIPPEHGQPQLHTHEGYEWLYVLAGQIG